MSVYIHQAAFMIPGASNMVELNDLLQSKAPVFRPWHESFAGFVNDEVFSRTDFDPTNKAFQRIDRVAQFATVLTKELAHHRPELLHIGSARGATSTWEREFQSFLERGTVGLYASPTTTLGNLAFSAARLAGLDADVMEQSMTCSSGFHSIIEACKRITSGNITTAIAGGVEASLTDFSYAQFEQLRLLSKESLPLPSKPLSSKRANQLVLAEGGALFVLSSEKSDIELIGFGESWAKTIHSLEFASDALTEAMQRALKMAGISSVDAVFMHAPGTLQGDAAEITAVRTCLSNEVRLIPSKWCTGHALGASGPISMVLAIALLNGIQVTAPYTHDGDRVGEDAVKTILINATGFGGNAASIIIRKKTY